MQCAEKNFKRAVSTSASKHGDFCLRLELPKEVNFHFLLNKYGDLSFFLFSFFKKKSGYFLPLECKLVPRTDKEAIVVDEFKSCTRKNNHIGI